VNVHSHFLKKFSNFRQQGSANVDSEFDTHSRIARLYAKICIQGRIYTVGPILYKIRIQYERSI